METLNPRRDGRLFLAAALLILTLGCILQATVGYSHSDLSGHAAGSDDAYISYRYALNVLAGHGLVFNAGERVEGYTNLLYVLLMVPAAWLTGHDGLYAASVAVNLGFAGLVVVQVFGFARQRLGSLRAGMAALIVALCPSLWVAVASGLETPLVLCLQVAIWIAAERTAAREGDRQVYLLAGLCVLLILTRADGFVVPCLAAGYLFLRGRQRAALGVAATAATATALIVAWRLWYYGWPLPNTFYAKVAGPLTARIDASLEQIILVISTTGLLIPCSACCCFSWNSLAGYRAFASAFHRPSPFRFSLSCPGSAIGYSWGATFFTSASCSFSFRWAPMRS